jgi:glycosyltransferase involved in cell wall biosynthesis
LNKKINILYFVAEDWYFWSHRKLLALAALDKGYDVYVVSRVNNHGQKIEDLGFKLIPITIDRHGKNIIKELKLLKEIIKIYRRIRPDIVHQIAIKPILYGTIATLFTRTTKIANTFPGLGYVFESKRFKDISIRFFLINIFKLLFMLRPVKVIVQNKDNANLLISEGVCKEKDLSLIRGSGVDLREYVQSDDVSDTPIILFASRLLWQKGIADFVAAASIVRKNITNVRFVIVGEPDKNNPNSVPEATLNEWNEGGLVEWWGYQSQMPKTLSKVKMVVLPSFYGEGVPKILIEAAACEKPIITTDMPGCREIVIHKHNGFLVEPHSPEAIAEHVKQLLEDDELCKQMGKEGRRLVESEFSIEKVNLETLLIYDELLGATG